MPSESDKHRVEAFMIGLGRSVRVAGCIYLTGGTTAVLYGWRDVTIDIDLLKADPEPAGLFEAIAQLKNELDVKVELARPDEFIPPLLGWRERSLFIAREGSLDFFPLRSLRASVVQA